MTPTTPQGRENQIDPQSGDRAMSLSFVLQALAHDAGHAIDHDDLDAALGLSWMAVAVPDEDDLVSWPMHARDAFLIPAGQSFGMTIRDIHPPEAARGLSRLPEFRQHFDASYRPLILRALEHDQPVLAWQGWPGEQTKMWGVVTEACTDGIGLAGWVSWPSEAPPCEPKRESPMPAPLAWACHPRNTLILDKPPVQLYVVEGITPTQPDSVDLLEIVLAHGRRVLDNSLEDRFGVVTGPAAYDLWIERLRGTTGSDTRFAQGHRQMASSIIAAHESGIRFHQRQAPRTATMQSLVTTLTEKCQAIVKSVGQSLEAATSDTWTSNPVDRAKVAEPLARARDATSEMLTALESHARAAKPK